MLTQICNLIGYTMGTSSTGDVFMYGLVTICTGLAIFYLFDTIHDIVNRIGVKK